MEKSRRNEIAYQVLSAQIRKSREYSFQRIENLKREIGNAVKTKELQEKDITKEELQEFSKELLKEVFDRVIKDLN